MCETEEKRSPNRQPLSSFIGSNSPPLLVFSIKREMASCREITQVIMAIYMPLIVIITVMIIGGSEARELRPSYHGLEYQSLPPTGEKLPPEMKTFFGSASSSMAPPTSTSSNVALPNAMNSNDTSWWNSVGGGRNDGGGGDHVRHVLFVASLACGVTGVALLLASALIFFIKNKRQTSSSRNNSTAIVVATTSK